MTKASGEDNPKKKGFPSLETLMQHTATNRSYLSTFQAEEVELKKMKAKARTAMPINKQSPSLKKKNSRPISNPALPQLPSCTIVFKATIIKKNNVEQQSTKHWLLNCRGDHAIMFAI